MKYKKLVSIMITTVMALGTLTACGGSQPASSGSSAAPASSGASAGGNAYLGTLSLLNMTEEEYLSLANAKQLANVYLEKEGVFSGKVKAGSSPKFSGVKFYDTLDAMVMALEAGDIACAELPKCTAEYLCAHNEKLETLISYNMNKADNFDKQLVSRLGVGFSFMTKEDNKALRDEIDKAIGDMKSEGTLNSLIKNYINEGVFSEQKEVEFEKMSGDTLKIAVTGSLPPMDYVAPDGRFAGFNTAICAELGKKLGKNIELIQVDSMGRAAALSSGKVDAVFWTCGSNEEYAGGNLTKEDYEKYLQKLNQSSLDPERVNIMKELSGGIDYEKNENRDRPQGTIVTQPYYSDQTVIVGRK